MSYTPRAGSKTEAAVAFLKNRGGTALCTEIRDEVDIDLKNQIAAFQAAVDNGLMERVETEKGMAYRLCDGEQQQETRAETMARELRVSKVIPARKPPPTAKTSTRAMAKMPKLKTSAELEKKPGRRQKTAPRALNATFTCGRFMDGSIRIEGIQADMKLDAFDDGNKIAITISPAAGRQLVEFLSCK
jgi:hypothetical protein